MFLTKLLTLLRKGHHEPTAQSVVQHQAEATRTEATATTIETSATGWKSGIELELAFWDRWLASGGTPWPEDFQYRCRPDAPLDAQIAEALAVNAGATVHVLDVGAGPLTAVGKQWAGHTLHITAIAPLAAAYDKLLHKHQLTPKVRTQEGFAERLGAHFGEDRFDLVYARNCIDHSHDPCQAIQQMVAVAKPGGLVYMYHAVNEAQTQNYQGLHQWNLFCKGGDLYVSDLQQEVNINQLLAPIAEVESQLQLELNWMVNLIRKRDK